MNGVERIERAIEPNGCPSIAAFLTAGYPTPQDFERHLRSVATSADVVEIGVPFSDPMADGVTIQRTSRIALEQGITLAKIFDTLARIDANGTPLLLMSYVNPLLAMGAKEIATRAISSNVSGFIVPDLPLEEQEFLAHALDDAGLALIQLVTPATPEERAEKIARSARGFVYAVAMNGTTGGTVPKRDDVAAYLSRIKRAARCPVLAGFGVRTAADVRNLVPPADGVIVGSALIEAIESGRDPGAFLEDLR
jgi:tryptophan synthase alpha chain